ncbi:MAG: outer membrane lipoprotein-sorting protein [Tannerella sp.]|jgi:outer membrane lipoprotein-sorting protein|nr:outer membrane lipoprotein-sorting protein [Tannerella sp.]
MKKLAIIFATLLPGVSPAQDAGEIVRKAENLLKGENTSYSEMSMQIVRPKYTRTVEFKSWAETDGNSMTLITAPANEKGQSFMKMGNNMWNWNPTIQRLIKMPPSMMSQGWMGSDFSNDDVLKESSLVRDFTHKLIGEETVSGLACYKIELTPLAGADVVWGKVLIWISIENSFEMKVQYFDEEDEPVKTHTSSDIKTFDGRRLPSVMEIVPAENPQNKTVITIKDIRFNIAIEPGFFSQQNMKKLK